MACEGLLLAPDYPDPNRQLSNDEELALLTEGLHAWGCRVRVARGPDVIAQARAWRAERQPGELGVVVTAMHGRLFSGALEVELPDGPAATQWVPGADLLDAVEGDESMDMLVVFDTCAEGPGGGALQPGLGLDPGPRTGLWVSAAPGQAARDLDAFSLYLARALLGGTADRTTLHGGTLEGVVGRARDSFVQATQGNVWLGDQRPTELHPLASPLYLDILSGRIRRDIPPSLPMGMVSPQAALVPLVEAYASAQALVGAPESWPPLQDLLGTSVRGVQTRFGSCVIDDEMFSAVEGPEGPRALRDWVLSCASGERDRTQGFASDADPRHARCEAIRGALRGFSPAVAERLDAVRCAHLRPQAPWDHLYRVDETAWCEVLETTTPGPSPHEVTATCHRTLRPNELLVLP